MNKRPGTLIIVVLGMLIALSPFSIDMYLPAFPAIAAALHTNIARVGYSLTSYYAGLCVGQLIYGILIDRFGRKKPLLAGLLIYLAAGLCCALAGGINLLIGVRLFMALGGCVGMVAARAIVRDLYPPEEMAGVLSLLVLVMGIAPVIAPTIGGLIGSWLGWRWVFGTMALIGALLIPGVWLILPETKTADKRVSLKPGNISAAYLAVLRNPTFLKYTLAGGISYAGMYAYIAGSPFVFMQKFGFSDTAYGWAFALNACGLIAGSQLNRLALRKYTSATVVRVACALLFLTGLGLLLVTWAGIAGPAITLAFIFFFLFWIGFINPNTTALALAPFTAAAGRASAVLGSSQMIAGVAASWLVSFFNNGTTLIMPVVMFGCTLISFLLLAGRKRAQRTALAVS
ncbi:DHA1 family bicyclomycin/chloramphenicol resistance-like MFS transporter [Mucilaginibacter yixingensis]|uniref:DHA1 family bicyclomycin/chloramphenicol resistance-like MFS transporter n=1 Tax=Mucilaginibacter yixingensis TaxID=1295612 RepID=A0A2T5JGM2_9SPHI|nr:multidrug effflux MFS transporter [Mucilaginibacter yixingensis]PTR01506.1 DHA1 family bicyclomycin/chloramphenicol resistance-like MFS transporter [Mucilaginibacter yixingensis]